MRGNVENNKLRLWLRALNILFFTGVWLGVVYWTDQFGDWVSMGAQAVVVFLPAVFIHIALRKDDPPA